MFHFSVGVRNLRGFFLLSFPFGVEVPTVIWRLIALFFLLCGTMYKEVFIAYFIIPCLLLSQLFASSIFCFNLFYFLLEHFTSLVFHVYSFTCIIPPMLMKCVHYCPVR